MAEEIDVSKEREQIAKAWGVTLGKQLRYRVNVSVSTKNVKTWDCTVDATGYLQGEVLTMSDGLVKELESRYPIKVEV